MSTLPTVEELVRTLALSPHPEGGFYRETYRSAASDADGRALSTAIYFLVPRGAFSALHRIRSDELWHFHLGAPLRVVCLTLSGARVDHLLGTDLAAGERPQAVVPAGTWFGAHVDDHEDAGGQAARGQPARAAWSLVSCTVAPGFEFRDFELGTRAALRAAFPQHADLVTRLTREE